MNHFEKLAKLRELYPEDVDRILAVCRKDILAARKMLATNRKLTDEERAEAWHIIDARLWFVWVVVKDFVGELAQLDHELEAEPSRSLSLCPMPYVPAISYRDSPNPRS